MKDRKANYQKRVPLTEESLNMLYELFESTHKEGKFLSVVCNNAIKELYDNRNNKELNLHINLDKVEVK